MQIVASAGWHHITYIGESDGHMKVHDIWDCSNEVLGSWYIRTLEN